ncbi:MAG: hypothetical protein EOP06_15815 [Proteobacteria bacterium]|nr:MAG: hypothetical protein EOP06_15815 [Pseudomonadota bacterium]
MKERHFLPVLTLTTVICMLPYLALLAWMAKEGDDNCVYESVCAAWPMEYIRWQSVLLAFFAALITAFPLGWLIQSAISKPAPENERTQA